MPVVVNIASLGYSDEFSADQNIFAATYSPLFNGLAGTYNYVKILAQLEYHILLNAEQFSIYEVKYEGGVTKIPVSTEAPNSVFSVGDLVYYESFYLALVPPVTPVTIQGTATVVFVSDSEIWLDDDFSYPVSNVEKTVGLKIIGLSEKNFVEYATGLVQNGDPYSNISFVTNESMAFYTKTATQPPNTLKTLAPLGVSNSWRDKFLGVIKQKDSLTGTYFSFGNNGADANPLIVPYAIQQYELNTGFFIPFYTEDERENIINGIAPNSLLGDNSLKHVFQLRFKKTLADTSPAVGVFDSNNGSVGWLGESFNGFTSQYSVENVVIRDLLNELKTTVDVAGSKVSFRLKSVGGSFVASQKILVYWQMMPDEGVYLNKANRYDQNINQEVISITAGSSGPISQPNIFQSYSAVLVNSETIDVEVVIDPNADQFGIGNSYDIGDYFALYTVVGKQPIIATPSNDVVSLFVKIGQLEKNTDVPDLLFNEGFEILAPDENYYTDYVGGIEDGITVKNRFKLDTTKNAQIDTLNVEFIGYDPLNGSSFLIKSEVVNFTSLFINGQQEINIETTRGFNAIDEVFNVVKLKSDTFNGQFRFYDLEYSTKIPFRENILVAAPDVFFDNTKPLNGLNEKASNYSDLNGYEVRLQIRFGVNNGEVITQYAITSPKLRIFDYHEIIA